MADGILDKIKAYYEDQRKAELDKNFGVPWQERANLLLSADPSYARTVEKYKLTPEQIKQIHLNTAGDYAQGVMGSIAPAGKGISAVSGKALTAKSSIPNWAASEAPAVSSLPRTLESAKQALNQAYEQYGPSSPKFGKFQTLYNKLLEKQGK